MDQEIKPQVPLAESVAPEPAPQQPVVVEEQPKPQQPMAPKKTSTEKGSKVPLIIGIVIGIVLIVLGYMTWQKQEDTSSSDATSSTKVTPSETAPVSSADVSSTTSDVDKTITELDDTKDFPSDDLSDTTLGL